MLIIARGSLLVVAASLASAGVLAGCSGTTPTQSSLAYPQTLMQPRTGLTTPDICGTCCPRKLFHILPRRSTIQVNQQVTLYSCLYFQLGGCHRMEAGAAWKSRGGSLQVIDGGGEAIFSASSPGTYIIRAKYQGVHSRATLIVTAQ